MKVKAYLVIGALICLWFTIATASGWRAPKMPTGSGGFRSSYGSGYSSGYGRSYGGSWGSGK
ncbi:hypothetical protein SAMN06265222_101139 [Neorhodopirellula lusitana]|uniref:Uncharacterized protein n=1 Tax=Neorhodopirellula lusitana TaxID=445327 RepID=A0ABY1PN25_9BACT|nr:hypothetical protein [Neorhodopirellula lusitana]SMP38464.1 hypothetical protein SAMN06265222_101139 [Neorhodopirellula lusitana]